MAAAVAGLGGNTSNNFGFEKPVQPPIPDTNFNMPSFMPEKV